MADIVWRQPACSEYVSGVCQSIIRVLLHFVWGLTYYRFIVVVGQDWKLLFNRKMQMYVTIGILEAWCSNRLNLRKGGAVIAV